MSIAHSREKERSLNTQLEYGQIGQAIILLTPDLVVEVVLEDADVRRVVPI